MNLSAWLEHISSVHPREIELGLDRVRRVAERLALPAPAPQVFTIAGTNGKGSTAAAIEAVLRNSGLQVGCYLSPHVHRFNERIRIDGADCADWPIVTALERVERARAGVSLSYFEFATLAALWLFARAKLDAAVLEVGLGGRLDAVNIVDADIAVITNIEFDHQDWLGETRDEIGIEKAGVLRAGKPWVCGDENPPGSLVRRARELNAAMYRAERDYGADPGPGGWTWRGRTEHGNIAIEGLDLPRLPMGAMAAALQAVHLSPLAVSEAGIRAAAANEALPGRLELRRDAGGGAAVLLDVAHNPAAARRLAARIAELRDGLPAETKVGAVFALLADKDIEGMARALRPQVDVWYIAGLDDSRKVPVAELLRRLRGGLPDAEILVCGSVAEAYRAAVATAAGLVVVTGSFLTVAAARPFTCFGAGD